MNSGSRVTPVNRSNYLACSSLQKLCEKLRSLDRLGKGSRDDELPVHDSIRSRRKSRLSLGKLRAIPAMRAFGNSLPKEESQAESSASVVDTRSACVKVSTRSVLNSTTGTPVRSGALILASSKLMRFSDFVDSATTLRLPPSQETV